MITDSPCYLCQCRHEGCHGSCELYRKWDAEVQRQRERAEEAQKGDLDANKFKVDCIRKIAKRRRSKHKY